MSGPGSALFDWDLLDEAPSVTSFTLDQAEEREKEIGRFEETILEGAGRAADALAGSSSDPTAPGAQDDSHYVKCELLTQDALPWPRCRRWMLPWLSSTFPLLWGCRRHWL